MFSSALIAGTASAQSRPAESGPGRVATAVLANGLRLEYLVQGDPAGIPVILLHGYTDSRRSWDRILPLLPTSLRIFAPTQRGHGESDKPGSGYRMEDFSTDVRQFMNAVGLRQAIIVGHSMGSTVARRFAMDHPDRVSGLVLVGAFGTLAGSPILEGFWKETIEPLEDPITEEFVVEFQGSTITRPVPPEFFNLVVGESRKAPLVVWKGVIRELTTTDLSNGPTIQAPTLIVWGDQDAFVPRAEQDLLLAAIPGSKLVTYPGTGHGNQWEEPERFAGDLVRFVTGVGKGAAVGAGAKQ